MIRPHGGALIDRILRGTEREAALKDASVEYELCMYEGAQHAFFNDTGTRYHPEAAKLAWERTIALFKRKLS